MVWHRFWDRVLEQMYIRIDEKVGAKMMVFDGLGPVLGAGFGAFVFNYVFKRRFRGVRQGTGFGAFVFNYVFKRWVQKLWFLVVWDVFLNRDVEHSH